MYKLLWNTVIKFDTHIEKNIDKRKLFLFTSVLLNSVIGLLIWLVIGRLFLPQLEWLICFVGYPAVITGYIGGIAYLYRNT